MRADDEEPGGPDHRRETYRREVIHVVGKAKAWPGAAEDAAIEAGENDEDRRLAYVAMTRARHLLVVGLPAAHYDRHSLKWHGWGFKAFP